MSTAKLVAHALEAMTAQALSEVHKVIRERGYSTAMYMPFPGKCLCDAQGTRYILERPLKGGEVDGEVEIRLLELETETKSFKFHHITMEQYFQIVEETVAWHTKK